MYLYNYIYIYIYMCLKLFIHANRVFAWRILFLFVESLDKHYMALPWILKGLSLSSIELHSCSLWSKDLGKWQWRPTPSLWISGRICQRPFGPKTPSNHFYTIYMRFALRGEEYQTELYNYFRFHPLSVWLIWLAKILTPSYHFEAMSYLRVASRTRGCALGNVWLGHYFSSIRFLHLARDRIVRQWFVSFASGGQTSILKGCFWFAHRHTLESATKIAICDFDLQLVISQVLHRQSPSSGQPPVFPPETDQLLDLPEPPPGVIRPGAPNRMGWRGLIRFWRAKKWGSDLDLVRLHPRGLVWENLAIGESQQKPARKPALFTCHMCRKGISLDFECLTSCKLNEFTWEFCKKWIEMVSKWHTCPIHIQRPACDLGPTVSSPGAFDHLMTIPSHVYMAWFVKWQKQLSIGWDLSTA